MQNTEVTPDLARRELPAFSCDFTLIHTYIHEIDDHLYYCGHERKIYRLLPPNEAVRRDVPGLPYMTSAQHISKGRGVKK